MASVVSPGSPLAQIKLSSPKPVLFIGDYFVTCFPRYCARETIIICGIWHDLVHFSTLGAGGAGIPFVHNGAPPSVAQLADMIILQIRGNDLNDSHCDPIQHARNILSLARKFISEKGVLYVAICQLCYRVLPRGKRLALPSRHPLRPHYNSLVDQVNVELKRLIDFFPKCVYWKHHGTVLLLCDMVSVRKNQHYTAKEVSEMVDSLDSSSASDIEIEVRVTLVKQFCRTLSFSLNPLSRRH